MGIPVAYGSAESGPRYVTSAVGAVPRGGKRAHCLTANNLPDMPGGPGLFRQRGKQHTSTIEQGISRQDMEQIMTKEISTIDLHLQPMASDLSDSTVTEVVVNRPGEFWLERRSGWQRVDAPWLDFPWCDDLAKLMANRVQEAITDDWPILGGQMPGEHRMQIVAPPAVQPGTYSFTMRRPSDETFTLAQLIDSGTFMGTRCVQSVTLPDAERDRIEPRLQEFERHLLSHFRRQDWLAWHRSLQRGASRDTGGNICRHRCFPYTH